MYFQVVVDNWKCRRISVLFVAGVNTLCFFDLLAYTHRAIRFLPFSVYASMHVC